MHWLAGRCFWGIRVLPEIYASLRRRLFFAGTNRRGLQHKSAGLAAQSGGSANRRTAFPQRPAPPHARRAALKTRSVFSRRAAEGCTALFSPRRGEKRRRAARAGRRSVEKVQPADMTGKTCGTVGAVSLVGKRGEKAAVSKKDLRKRQETTFPADFFALTPKNAEKALEISKNIVYNEKSNSQAVAHILCAILP